VNLRDSQVDSEDSPERLLGLEPGDAPTQEPEVHVPGWWWISALLMPLLGFAVGVVICFSIPRMESDWFGARYLLALSLALMGGCLLSVLCCVIAFVRRESHAWFSLLVGFPSLVYVIWALITAAGAYLQSRR